MTRFMLLDPRTGTEAEFYDGTPKQQVARMRINHYAAKSKNWQIGAKGKNDCQGTKRHSQPRYFGK